MQNVIKCKCVSHFIQILSASCNKHEQPSIFFARIRSDVGGPGIWNPSKKTGLVAFIVLLTHLGIIAEIRELDSLRTQHSVMEAVSPVLVLRWWSQKGVFPSCGWLSIRPFHHLLLSTFTALKGSWRSEPYSGTVHWPTICLLSCQAVPASLVPSHWVP